MSFVVLDLGLHAGLHLNALSENLLHMLLGLIVERVSVLALSFFVYRESFARKVDVAPAKLLQ